MATFYVFPPTWEEALKVAREFGWHPAGVIPADSSRRAISVRSTLGQQERANLEDRRVRTLDRDRSGHA